MDVERTIEFILQAQAKAEIRMDKMDKRIDAITKILQQGMRMLVKTDVRLAELAQAQKRTDARLAELAGAQTATERSLKAFIDSLRHGRNGRTGH